MTPDRIRNIAIIAHVDHGKTTLVDQLFRQSGMFRESKIVAERLMDSMDLERERGITIMSKNGSFRFEEYLINLIDTPGHADFGGQVERVLKMADGALLLVDAEEGPMPQTYFVLKKALALRLPIVVIVNKIDKQAARPQWVVDQVFDLFVRLQAPDDILDFPILFASARDGYARNEPDETGTTLVPLCRQIIRHIPAPSGDPAAGLQLLVSSIDYSPYLGRLGIGKITAGSLRLGGEVVVVRRGGGLVEARITKIFRFEGPDKVPTEAAGIGEIVAVAGMAEITVGETYTDRERSRPLPFVDIDPPTIAVEFMPNDSPFAGRDGTPVTPRQLAERLEREALADAALSVDALGRGKGFKVSGRGELHLAILMERMRREGCEFQVSRPQVIFREENGRRLEPYEELTVDVAAEVVGSVIEKLGLRKGRILSMESEHGMVRILYRIPTRGLLGFRSEFLTDTRGMGVMNYVFAEYSAYAGEIRTRRRGVLVSMQTCTTAAYALFNLEERGRLFVGPGVDVYNGAIIGEHCRDGDLSVNPGKGKKLTNVRASGTDTSIILTPPVTMVLEECLSFVNDDELVEVTPASVRLRKKKL